jgi:hypothetical protein
MRGTDTKTGRHRMPPLFRPPIELSRNGNARTTSRPPQLKPPARDCETYNKEPIFAALQKAEAPHHTETGRTIGTPSGHLPPHTFPSTERSESCGHSLYSLAAPASIPCFLPPPPPIMGSASSGEQPRKLNWSIVRSDQTIVTIYQVRDDMIRRHMRR